MKNILFAWISLFILFSCKQNKEERTNSHTITVKEAKGYVVPNDSIKQPVEIPAGDPISVKATNPDVVPANMNTSPVGKPVLIIPQLVKCTPGTDSFSMPEIITVKDTAIVCSNPESVILKDASSKDQNPENFSGYSKLQGLKQPQVRCLHEDKKGNLWFGSEGGGVCCYNGKTFTHYLDKDGLAGNVVYSIAETKNNTFWFATHLGLCSYNGKTFKRYSDSKGITTALVFSVVEDATGNIWFASTGGGVGCFDGKTIKLYTDKQGLCPGVINCLTRDSKGNIWAGSNTNGVCYFDGKSFVRLVHKETISNYSIRNIYEDKTGNIWFATEGTGILSYNGKALSGISAQQGLASPFVLSAYEDSKGIIWFGTNGGGLIKYDRKGKNSEAWNSEATFTNFTTQQGLPGNIVNSVLEDRTGKLWIALGGSGLCRYDGQTFTHFTDKEGLATHLNFSMLQDKHDNIWLGTFAGVTCYNGKTFAHYSAKQGLGGSLINAIHEDKQGKLWFGSYGGGTSSFDGQTFNTYNKKNNFPNNFIWSIIGDKNNNLWFGSFGGGVICSNGKTYKQYTTKEGVSHDYIYFLKEDPAGNIWIGTNGGGLTKFDGKTFTHFTEKEGLANNAVYSGLVDKNGNLWFGTGAGACYYNGKTFTYFTEKEGLCNNVIMSMVQDKQGNIWFGTRNGLSKLSYKNFQKVTSPSFNNTLNEDDVLFKNFSYENGFLGIGCFRMAMCEAKDGSIWIGANDRLTVFHPEGEMADTVKPKVELTGLELYNETIAWATLGNQTGKETFGIKDTAIKLGNGVSIKDFSFTDVSELYSVPQNLSLAYNNNYLTFNFAGISLSQSKKLKYLYKLEGLDNDWSAMTLRTEAPYGNIPPGTYTFKVKAMNPEGIWSNETNYTFSIRPPWWETLTFRIVAVIAIILLIWLYIKWRERSLKERQKVLEHTVNDRTFELQQEKKLVETQKQLIEVKHKEITDSINYAERIQRALLANKEVLSARLKDYFILFKPKDVVSGDFYWTPNVTGSLLSVSGSEQITNNKKQETGNDELFYIAVCDSTGHGVPGAIMSILNMACMDKAMALGIESPDQLLNETRHLVIESLKNDGSEGGGKDGMDGVLIQLDLKTKLLKCAAANNPVWIIRNEELIEIKGDRMPIGRHEKDTTPFTLHTFQLQENDMVYLLTDGFADQFGGEKGKKFKYKRIQEVLLSVKTKSMASQQEALSKAFTDWKGRLEQIDDVCVIGIRI